MPLGRNEKILLLVSGLFVVIAHGLFGHWLVSIVVPVFVFYAMRIFKSVSQS